MTKKEAFHLIDGVLVQIKFTRQEHMQLMEAMKVLLGDEPLVSAVPPPAEEQPSLQ